MVFKCLLCDNDKFESLNNSFNLKKCLFCGLVLNSLRPDLESLEEYYANPHYYDYWSDNILDKEIERLKKTTYSYYLFKMKQYLAAGKYLDIGCGLGYSLETAMNLGWQSYGLEVSNKIAKITQKRFAKKIFVGLLEKSKIPHNFFNLISLFDVIEHFNNPLKCLTLINNLLVKDGYLMIVTPDINSLTAKLFKTYWPHFLPEHLTYFSCITLKKSLEKSGFETLYYEPAKKFQNFDYIVHRLDIYPKPILTAIAKYIAHLIPDGFNKKMFPLKTGEMFILARKKKDISFYK